MANNLKAVKENIEKMSKHHQIEILRILTHLDSVCINENSNGTFINLTEQTNEVILCLNKYIKYVQEQQQQFNIIEDKKEQIQESFFKDNKEIANNNL